MTDELDPLLRARLDRLARAVPLEPERMVIPIASVGPRYRGRSSLGVLAAAGLVLVLAFAAASMGGGADPTETMPPTTTNPASPAQPSASRVVQLPTWSEAPASGACPEALLGGVTLRGDPRSQSRPVWVESRGGGQLTVVWPYGFSSRFSPGLELLDSDGEVVAREGDLLDLTGGAVASLDPAFDFYACRVAAGAPSPDWTWGPLAVIPPQDGTDLARNEGTLRITDACVYLEDPGGDLWLLTWTADRTTWSEESRSITFENFAAFDGTIVTVGDGDPVVLGGGGSSEAESGISGEEWVRRVDWVAPPAPSCSLDLRFHVGVVEPVGWGPLAVADDDAEGDLDAGTGPGRLVVGPRCVTLLQDAGAELTLIWRSGQTGWDPDADQIVFVDRNAGVLRLSDGERLSLGGAGLADPSSPDQGAAQPEWLAPPDASCPDARWLVHQVYLLDP